VVSFLLPFTQYSICIFTHPCYIPCPSPPS
jgi:hypothetical protein